MVKQDEKITPQQKGTHLEDAVRLIEQTILNSKPGLKEFPFSIETRKIFVADGVRHEIDVYVEIDLGHGYKSIFIFECKNWKDPVGKNELIIFSEKLKITNAQKGYFATKQFTRDAENQAAKDERIELLEVTADTSILLSFPDFHSIERDQSKIHINADFIKRGTARENIEYQPISPDDCKVELDGTSINLTKYINEKSSKVIEGRINNEPTHRLPEGVYNYEYNETLFYEPGSFIAKGFDIERLELNITFPMIVTRPKIKYAFEVGQRGKVISYESTTSKGDTIGVAFIQTKKEIA
jgi:hypothetical protein